MSDEQPDGAPVLNPPLQWATIRSVDKRELRAAMRTRRSALATPDAAGHRVMKAVMRHIRHDSSVACYVSLPGEPPTRELLSELKRRGNPVYLPVALAEGRLEWISLGDLRLSDIAAWGLPGQPDPPQTRRRRTVRPDVVVTPALAVSDGGARLGNGGGYYDRFLGVLPPRSLRLGVVWVGEVLGAVPEEEHDVRLDAWVEIPPPVGPR